MNLFYTPDITSDSYTLSEDESKHCVRVLRLVEGDQIQLIDGHGGFYVGEITDANPKRCSIKIIETQKEYGKRNFYLHLAVAPTKNIERLEWFLEKATEIGIDEITPLICHHSERKFVKPEILHKVMVAAAKQSLKAYVPKLNEPISFHSFMEKSFDGSKYIAHCSPTLQEKVLLKNRYEKNKNALILIGPEGDFSQKEIELALTKDFSEVSLGINRLRTETAAVVACHTINIINE